MVFMVSALAHETHIISRRTVKNLKNIVAFQGEALAFFSFRYRIGGLHPIPGDPKDNEVAAMLDDRTF